MAAPNRTPDPLQTAKTDPATFDLGNRRVPYARRNYRLDFLQLGPSESVVRCALTRHEILAEVRRLCHTWDRRPNRSPLYSSVYNSRAHPHRISLPSPPPLRRRKGGAHNRDSGRSGRDINIRQPPSVSMTLPTSLRMDGAPASNARSHHHARFQSNPRILHPPPSTSGNRLTLRDLRQVDPSFTARPAIWVREEALVVSLEPIRAIILSDRMFLFNPDYDKVKNSLFNIEKRLSYNTEDAFMPFEFRALEGILIHTCLVLESEFLAIEPKLRNTLVNLPNQISNARLESLRVLEQRLNHFYAGVRKVQSAIQTVLDEDEDMAEMYLTEKRKSPGVARNPLDHDEAEMLLETHLQIVDDITGRAGLLNQAIDDTENLIEIHLDTMQNRVLLVDLMITSVTTTLSFGTLITGIFGMNLPLPAVMGELPSSHYYFWGLVLFTIATMGIALLFLTRWCRAQGLYGGSSGPTPQWEKWLANRLGPKLNALRLGRQDGDADADSGIVIKPSLEKEDEIDAFEGTEIGQGESFDIHSVP